MRHLPRAALLIAAGVGLSGCGGGATAEDGRAGESTITVTNCEEEVTVATVPERVVIMSGSAVPLLSAVDALDRVVARGGDFATEVYDDATAEEVEAIPALSIERGDTGGVELSLEVLLDTEPDLVIGYATDTITRAGLAAVGVPLLVQPGFCDGASEPDIDFDDVYDEVELYGRIFQAEEAAGETVDDLRERVEAVQERVDEQNPRSAALLYISGSGVLSVYGNRGLVHDQLGAAGLDNVFGEVDKRVFDIGVEELLGRDPEVVIILRDAKADPDELIDAFMDMTGVEDLAAVRDDAVTTQIFDYGDPPTPLSVTGLEMLVERIVEP